ncbi:YibE/F family protein [Eubacterium sp.]
MKKYSNIIFVVFLILFIAGLWLFNSRVTRVPLLSDDNFNFVKGEVVEITEDNTTDNKVNGGSQNVKVKIKSGKYKGKICSANNMNGYLYGTYCVKGTKVIVQLSSYNDELSGSIYGYDRGNIIWGIVALLAIALFAVGGKRGLKSMLALIFTFVCIIYLYIPLMYIGWSPFWAAVLVVIFITIVSIYLICGYNKKGLCAMIGTILGVLIAGIFATLFGKMTRITGLNIEDIETMVYVSQNSKLQIGGVLFSGILIASLGAVMDVAVSISSTMEEIHNKRPELTTTELFKSGIHVGKDMMGTMSNTLILAFTGGAINTMILIYAYIMPYLQIVNMYSIGIEVIKGISGTLGIILTVPMVSAISAWMFGKTK